MEDIEMATQSAQAQFLELNRTETRYESFVRYANGMTIISVRRPRWGMVSFAEFCQLRAEKATEEMIEAADDDEPCGGGTSVTRVASMYIKTAEALEKRSDASPHHSSWKRSRRRPTRQWDRHLR